MSDEPRRSLLERVTALGRALETTLLAVLLGGLIVFASAQIVLRNFFSISVNWGDSFVRLTVLWLALLGALAASRDDRHITMGILSHWLPPTPRRIAEVVADTFAALFCGTFAWFALAFVRDSRAYGDTAFDVVPAWWLQSIMPLAFALIAYRYAIRAIKRARGR